jgi:hypothetical protein
MFSDIKTLLRRFASLGAVRSFCKPLAENDNSKQQIYLGGSFDIVQMFPFDEVKACSAVNEPNFKAQLCFRWITADSVEPAPGAQLILYPEYPEVRLSGFLRGCKKAPNEHLRHIPADQRQFNNGPDGRVLFFGVTGNGETLAYLAPAGSFLAQEFWRRQGAGEYSKESVFYALPLPYGDTKTILLSKLAEIRDFGWHSSIRLNKTGMAMPYKARNGGGYTLEALLGIIPNGRSEPDYLGWELKAFSSDRVTLMTPEPDAGMYGETGVEPFVRRFGRPVSDDTLYFTGTHRAGCRNVTTGLTMNLRGFNPDKLVIEDVNGAIELLTDAGENVAAWSFSDLMLGWNKKHAQAAYVPYLAKKDSEPAYRYFSPALLGEGTDFSLYLSAISGGQVIFDPGSKVMKASTSRSSVKARSQFRISVKYLPALYRNFGPSEF